MIKYNNNLPREKNNTGIIAPKNKMITNIIIIHITMPNPKPKFSSISIISIILPHLNSIVFA